MTAINKRILLFFKRFDMRSGCPIDLKYFRDLGPIALPSDF